MAANSVQNIFDNGNEMVLGMKENDYLRPLNVRVVNLGEIVFAESDIWAKKDIKYNIQANTGNADHLYFSFILSGTLFGDCEGLFSTREFTADYAFGWYNTHRGGNAYIPGCQRIRRLSLAISNKFIDGHLGRSNFSFPRNLCRALESDNRKCWQKPFKLTPWMKTIFFQAENNPHVGKLGEIYIESLSLNLILLCLEQLDERKKNPLSVTLNSTDIDKIHFARKILLANMDNPPSIITLANQVGLNETKLKRGFRALFNSTIFSCHRGHRMQQAKKLLSKGDMNVSEVAYTVGYTNTSKFAHAFFQTFGILPKHSRKRAKN